MAAVATQVWDLNFIAQRLFQALDRCNPADAAIAPLTTAAGLKALCGTAGAQDDAEFKQERARAQHTFQAAIDSGFLTDTNVAASNTLAALKALCTTLNPGLDVRTSGPQHWNH